MDSGPQNLQIGEPRFQIPGHGLTDKVFRGIVTGVNKIQSQISGIGKLIVFQIRRHKGVTAQGQRRFTGKSGWQAMGKKVFCKLNSMEKRICSG